MARRFLSLYCPALAVSELTTLVEWCDRYSPLTAADGTNGVILDITGCTHLFGGEGQLLLDVQQKLHRMGVQAHGAISDTWGAAWALARYAKRWILHGENAASAIDPLPVEALRIPEQTALELRRLGLTTVATVRKIARNSLAVRFGVQLLERLDQIFQGAEEPLTPWRPPAPHRAMQSLEEPVITTSAVEHVLNSLLNQICRRLENECSGARHMELVCYRVDGTHDRCEIRTSKPTRSVAHALKLFSERLQTLQCGFGFEALVLSVLDTESLYPVQLDFSRAGKTEDDQSFDALVDRFGMKLGFEGIQRVQVCESCLPERAVAFRPVTASLSSNAEWPAYRIRPVRLFDPPLRIEVSILIPGESPVQFLMGHHRHRIVRSEGPERLTAEWWHQQPGTRDYYRIEDEQGFRFWIFQDSDEHWFMHGHLP